MANQWFDFRDPRPTRRQVRRLMEDAARLPDDPEGPHLDEEEFYRAVSGTLSTHARAMVHLETCRHCANDVAMAIRANDVAQQPGEAVATAAAAPAVEAFSAFEHEEWLRVDPVVAFASRGGFEARRLLTRAVQWQPSSSEPALECALDDERPDAVVFRVRTRDAAWAEQPLRFVIQDTATGATVADSWIVLHPETRAKPLEGPLTSGRPQAAPVQYSGGTRSGAVSPATWSAAVARCEFVAASPPGYQEIARLRQAIAAASDADRAVWRRWLDREAAAGRVSERIRAELLARS